MYSELRVVLEPQAPPAELLPELDNVLAVLGVDGVVLGDGDVRAPRHHVDGGDVGCGLGARGLELVIDGREQRSVGVALPRRHADEHHDVEGHVVGGFRVRARRGLGSRCRRRPERARAARLQEPRLPKQRQPFSILSFGTPCGSAGSAARRKERVKQK